METILIWLPVYFYTLATLLLLTAFVFNKARLLSWAGYFMVPGFVAHSAELALRWVRTGYFPGNGEGSEGELGEENMNNEPACLKRCGNRQLDRVFHDSVAEK